MQQLPCFVDCQACGQRVPAERWPTHKVEHLIGTRPVLSAVEAFARNPEPEQPPQSAPQTGHSGAQKRRA